MSNLSITSIWPKEKISGIFVQWGSLADFWLAFLVSMTGIIIRVAPFYIYDGAGDNFAKNYAEWVVQGLIYFPASALICGICINFIFRKNFLCKKNTYKLFAVSIVHYLAISYIASAIGIKSINPSLIFEYFLLLAQEAPFEFGVFGILFASTYTLRPDAVRLSSPAGNRFRQVIFATLVASVAIFALLNLEPKSKLGLGFELDDELTRIGDFADVHEEAERSNRIKYYERKFGLEVTGIQTSKLVKLLKQEDTKLVFTVGGAGADSDSVWKVCNSINSGRWNSIRKTLNIADNSTLNFKILIDQSYTPSDKDSCYLTDQIHLTIGPTNKDSSARSKSIDLKDSTLKLYADNNSQISIGGLSFIASGRANIIFLSGKIDFRNNSVSMPSTTQHWGVIVHGESVEKTRIVNSRFSNSSILVQDNAQADLEENSFSGTAHIETANKGIANSRDNRFNEK